MGRRAVSGITLPLLLIGSLMLMFNVQPVATGNTIYIRADGSIDPPTAPIQRDGNIYTFTDNINGSTIVVERDNIVLEGGGLILQGPGTINFVWGDVGLYIQQRENVTVKNIEIKAFVYGILLIANNSNIYGNTIMNNWWGIAPLSSLYNSIFENNITNNKYDGIQSGSFSRNRIFRNNIIENKRCGISLIQYSNYNIISENNVTNNLIGGIELDSSLNNSIAGNYIVNNKNGILLRYSSNNSIYHNNFINNTFQAFIYESSNNTWDDGYPSGGNYWSNYTDVDLYSGPYQNETSSDGIWDHPYVIDANNQDRYPLVNPWIPTPKVTSIAPSSPIAFGAKQLLTILGEGFVSNSQVNLSIGSNIYAIPRDRTWFVDSNKIEVAVGLTDIGLWQVWAINPGGGQSNKYAFQVRSFTTEDCEKVAALALQYWGPKNATIMAAIAVAESGLSPNAAGDRQYQKPNFLGYESWGLWQIHMPDHEDKLINLGAPTDETGALDPYKTAKWLIDPNNNVRAAYKVWEEANKIWGNGFRPWSTYKNGEYKKYLGMFERIISIFKSPVNVTITDDYGRIISEVENQIPEASFEYFEMTASKVFFLPLNLTYRVQLNATDYGNCTIGQITPLESIYETAFSQATFNLTSETVAEFDLLPYDANYTLKVDENGDGSIDYELTPEVETHTTEYDIGIIEIIPSKTILGQGYNLNITVKILNYGVYPESFDVSVFYDDTILILPDGKNHTTTTLPSHNSTTLTIPWNTTGVAKGNYTIKARATPVPGETDLTDNTYVDGIVTILAPAAPTGGGSELPPVFCEG